MKTSPLRLVVLGLAVLGAASCARFQRAERPRLPAVTAAQVVAMIPSHVRDRQGWATDVMAAFETLELHPDAPSVCSVLAVIEQESGFEANPTVADLPRIVEKRLYAHAEKYGIVGRKVLDEVLSLKAPGHKQTFAQRLRKVRTERDLDVLFRDLLGAYRSWHPGALQVAQLASELFTAQKLEDLNPVTTAGSMQVAVRYAEELARAKKWDAAAVRDLLYTRRGGVLFGTSRLLGYAADYDRPIYRFADYNAGFYASRNAAIQAQLTRHLGLKLARDGDLLAYDKAGKPLAQDSQSLLALLLYRARHLPSLSEGRVREDVEKEKSAEFEETRTWKALRQSFEALAGEPPPYALMPEVRIVSPKMARARSTRWFAENVNRRFTRCMAAASPARKAS